MREQVELQSNQLGLLHRYRYNAPNAHSQIQIQCNGCPSIFFYFAFFLYLFLTFLLLQLVAVARQGATCKMQSIDKIRFGSLSVLGSRFSQLHIRPWRRGAKIMEAPPDMGAISKATTVWGLWGRVNGGGGLAVGGLRAPFDLWHICY